MALPYSAYNILFAGAASTANATMSDDLAQNAGVVEMQLILTGFSGTVTFQGSVDGATWVNLPYQTLASGGLTLNSAAITYTTSTTNPTYILPMPMNNMRVAMTRSAGTISAYARGFSNPFDLTAASLYPAGTSPLTPWYTATFTKPDVTVAGSSGAWTTANSPITMFTVTGDVLFRWYGTVSASFTSTAGTGTLTIQGPALAGGTVLTISDAITVNNTTRLPTGAAWASGTAPDAASQGMPLSTGGGWYISHSGVIQVAIATNNMTAGGIISYLHWIPLTTGATVAAVTP